MNEEGMTKGHDRSTWAARFHSRMYRYRRLLLQRWWIPVSAVALALVIQGVVWRFTPQRYISVGRMIVSIRLSIQETSVYTEELSNFLGTQSALMQSGTVVNRARARAMTVCPEPTGSPPELTVSLVPKTTIFVLRAASQDPQYVQAFVQGCMEEYIKVKREMREKTSDTTLAGLTEEVLRLERDLRHTDEELAAFQTTNSVVLLQEQRNCAGNYLAPLNQKLAALKSEYDLLTTLTIDQSLDRQNRAAPALPGEKPGDVDVDYVRARQQILVLKAEQTELGQFLRPKHPKMIALADEIARRERLLEILKKQSGEQLETRRGAMRLQIQNLEKETKEWDARTLEISRKTGEYQKIKAGQQRVQSLYDRLLATMQTLDVNKEISPESVTIMEPAVPAFPENSPVLKKLIIAGLIGLAFSVGILMLIDRLDDRLNSNLELLELFDEEVIGQIPWEKPLVKGQEAGLIEPEDTRHAFVEAYRNLRSSLLYMGEKADRPKTLLVTSSIPNEGKSMTAANLAITLATTGSKTLLIDADLRKGALHQRFNRNDQPGLHEALADRLDWRAILQPTTVANLQLLARGRPTQRSSELFVSQNMRNLLQMAAAEYDYVVVDTAPVMAADDVTSLAPLLAGTIFVLRASHTSARVARAALELLYQRRVPVIGLVFNAVRTNSGDYYYYHHYRDYYKPYPGK